jgi:esterase/lipase superfamily enzyme
MNTSDHTSSSSAALSLCSPRQQMTVSAALITLILTVIGGAACTVSAPQERSPQDVVIPGSSETQLQVRVAPNTEFLAEFRTDTGANIETALWDSEGRLLAMHAASGGGAVQLAASPTTRTVMLAARNNGRENNTLTIRGGFGQTVSTHSVSGQQPSARKSPRTVIPVFYATDRQPIIRDGMFNVSYGTARNPDGTLVLGRFDVSLPRDDRHEIGKIERPDFYTLWSIDPERHFLIVERRQNSYESFYAQIADLVRKSAQKEAFVFIHGFNVTFDDAVYRTAQIAYDLHFDGAPIVYSWPSEESLTVTGYATDLTNNDWTVPHLRWFLEDVVAKTGAARIHVIAHSMGNRALVNALDRMSLANTGRFAHIFLTAPDIDASSFVQLAEAVKRNTQAATLYASANDKALKASKRLQSYCRAGDTSCGVVVIPGIDTVDVSAVDSDFLGHFYYGDNRSVISDIFSLLTQGLPPAKRFGLRAVGQTPNRYWRFVP